MITNTVYFLYFHQYLYYSINVRLTAWGSGCDYVILLSGGGLGFDYGQLQRGSASREGGGGLKTPKN